MSRKAGNPWVCTMSSAQSRDDLEIALAPKKNKKDKGLFAIFRSSSDPDLTSEMKNGAVVGKKHKEKFPNSKQLMGNGVHHRIPEEAFNEKGEIEETKENRRERKERERSEHRTEKRDKSSKKERDDKDKWEKKERKSEKEKGKGRDKEKKHSRRDEKEGSEADCSVCQEKLRKSREKSHSKESRHRDKEHVRSKSEHKRVKEYDNPNIKYSDQRSTDEDKEYKRKRHHHDREKEKDKPKKDKHHSKHHERHYDKHHKRRNEEEELRSIPCNPDHCSTCKASLSRLEAWQERCTAEIESARRRLEHRLQRLEKKLEHQRSDERQSRDKEIREKEYDRVVDRVTDECRAVNKSVKDSTGDVKEEIRGLIKGGLSKLELRLGQISTGYNIPFMDFKDRCNPELGRNCTASRRAVRSRSSPHLGRAPCADCASVGDQRMGVSPLNTPLSVSRSLTSGTDSLVSSRVSSHALASDTGSMETVIEARPVSEEEVLKVPETILEAKPVVEESVYNVKDTYAAAQVQHQRQIQEVEKWWRAKAEDEQRVLYARICELEQMLMMTRVGSGGDSGCIV